jgi:hypothetical protein
LPLSWRWSRSQRDWLSCCSFRGPTGAASRPSLRRQRRIEPLPARRSSRRPPGWRPRSPVLSLAPSCSPTADTTTDGPFIDSTGHRVYAKHLGKAVLKAGFVLEGHTNGALLRGLAFDVFDPGKTFHGAIVNVHGDGRDNSLLDLTLDGHRKLSAGIFVRQADGLLVRRVVARRFRDYGVFADANEQSLRLARRALVEDVDSRDVSRPVPRSSRGVAEACVWIGVTATVRRIRTRDCAWEGLWVGTGTRDSVFEDLDIDRSGVGIYVEHFASDSLFRRAHIGPDVVRGATCEWDDPAWGGRPACNDNVFETRPSTQR